MQKTDLPDLPDQPGVYFFRDSQDQILYVGKATSLRDRVRSYFSNDLIKTRGPRLVDMVTQAKTVTFEVSESVLEALVLEAHYIKKYQPKANSDGKDDKSFNHVVITKEDYPRVLLVRGKDLHDPLKNNSYKLQASFGPFPHAGQLKEALRIIRKIFPFFDTKKPVLDLSNRHDVGRLRFNQQIGIYPDTTDEEARAAYQETIRHLKLFFQGKKKLLVKELEKHMHQAAEREEFEEANRYKKQLFALTHINDVALLKHSTRAITEHMRIEAYDIAHLSGKAMVGVMTVLENGNPAKNEYRKFKIRSVHQSNDTAALREVLERRLGHNEWHYPNLIVIDGGKAQLKLAQDIMNMHGFRTPVVSVVKDERHRPREILGAKEWRTKYEREILLANSEAHRFAIDYHRNLRRKHFA